MFIVKMILLFNIFVNNGIYLLQMCTTAKHLVEVEIKPDPITAQNVNKCWTHFRSDHDIFINYRVATEGRQTKYSTVWFYHIEDKTIIIF